MKGPVADRISASQEGRAVHLRVGESDVTGLVWRLIACAAVGLVRPV
jgi:hypothetical protein